MKHVIVVIQIFAIVSTNENTRLKVCCGAHKEERELSTAILLCASALNFNIQTFIILNDGVIVSVKLLAAWRHIF